MKICISSKWLKSAVRNGFILLVPLVFISGFYGCGMGDRTVKVKVETANLLPKDIAIDYLNSKTPCTFNETGVIIKGEQVPYADLYYQVNDFIGWYVRVIDPDRYGKLCNLMEDLNKDRPYSEIEKMVTALESLGIRHYEL